MGTAGEEDGQCVFRWPVRVYYEDTDCAGIVYYANYLRFMERARTEWLRSLGIAQSALRDSDSVQFVVSRMSLELLRPARYDDLLDVGVVLKQRRRASFVLTQPVWRADELLCTAEVRIGCVDHRTLKPRPIPAAVNMEVESER